MHYTLEQIGYAHYLSKTGQSAHGVAEIGRISAEYGTHYTVLTHAGAITAVAPKTLRTGLQANELPKVGDWILIEAIPGDTKVKITSILPRYSELARKKAGKRLEAQVIATNVDTVCIVESLASPLDYNRIERFLTVPQTAGVEALLVLTKSDMVSDETKTQILQKTTSRFPNLRFVTTSTHTEGGTQELEQVIRTGESIVLIGPSGVGKSSLINALAKSEILAVGDVRHGDQKGRHTTTLRHLLVLPTGGILIDTPGMRELQVWGDADTSLDSAFSDIEALALDCKFSDCDHDRSAGCAIQNAITTGQLSQERYASYLKLKRELAHHATTIDYEAKLSRKKREKKLSQLARTIARTKRRTRSR